MTCKILRLHIGKLRDPVDVKITPEMEEWRVSELMEWLAKQYERAGGIGTAVRNEIASVLSRAEHGQDAWKQHLNLLVKDLAFEEREIERPKH